MLIWLSRQSTSLVRMRSPVRIRVLAPDRTASLHLFAMGCFFMGSLSIVGVRKNRKFASAGSDCNPLIFFCPGIVQNGATQVNIVQFLIVNILHLATELCCGKVFFMGATLWRSFFSVTVGLLCSAR